MKIKSIVCFLICAALLLSVLCVSVSAAPAAQPESVDGIYEKVAENESNILYLDKATGNIVLKNIATNTLWYSAAGDELSDNNTVGIEKSSINSPLQIEYVYTENATAVDSTGMEITNTSEECSEDSIAVEKINNGVKVIFTIDWLGVSIPVEYVLEEKGLRASILYDELVEGKDIYIIYMKLLPGFGAGKMNEQGYLVIPDGSGAVINFNNGSGTSEYVASVYGNEIDATSFISTNRGEKIHLPIFGIVKQNAALLGVITEGDDSAAICAYSSSPKKYGYNAASAKAVYRQNSQVAMFSSTFDAREVNAWVKSAAKGKFSVSYSFLGANQASYHGIASAYQDYLVSEGVLKKSETAPSMHLDIYNSIDKTTAFLGFKYKKQIALTTYGETKAILEELKAAGVTDVTAELIGWSGTGVTNNKIPTKVSYLSNLGGKKKFKSLSAFVADSGMTLVGDADFAYAREIKRTNAVQTYFNKIVYKYLYRNSVYTERRNTAQAIADADKMYSSANKFLGSYKKTGLGTISMDSLGGYFYTNFTKNGPQSRKYLIDKVEEALAAYDKAGYKISLSKANAYTFRYVDTVTAAPIGSSCYEMFDYDIPLYQLVLHGFITVTTESLPQTIDEDLTYLWAVSTGTEPMYNTIYEKASILQETEYDYLYSSTFDWWKDEAIEKYKGYEKLLNKVYNQKITGYAEVLPNVVATTYENGVQVYVNYNTAEQTVNGVKVPARGYKWIGGDSE